VSSLSLEVTLAKMPSVAVDEKAQDDCGDYNEKVKSSQTASEGQLGLVLCTSQRQYQRRSLQDRRLCLACGATRHRGKR